MTGTTAVAMYTGFQWRGAAEVDGGKTQKEIFFANEDGTVVSGRRLLTLVGDLGMEETLYRNTGQAKFLAIQSDRPQSRRALHAQAVWHEPP